VLFGHPRCALVYVGHSYGISAVIRCKSATVKVFCSDLSRLATVTIDLLSAWNTDMHRHKQ